MEIVDNLSSLTEVSEETFPWQTFFLGSAFYKKQAMVTGGFGLKRGRGAFDISCDFVEWRNTGIVAGPIAAMATLTVDFTLKKKF